MSRDCQLLRWFLRTNTCAEPADIVSSGVSDDWLQQQQEQQQQGAATSGNTLASDQAASWQADGTGALPPTDAAQQQQQQQQQLDDDCIVTGLAAADELQDASGAAALVAEAGSGGSPAQPLPAAPEPVGATRADVYADAAYWQDDDSAASPPGMQLAQPSAQASAPCATWTVYIVDTRMLQSVHSSVVFVRVIGFARCMLWSARCVLSTVQSTVQSKNGDWEWWCRGSRRAGYRRKTLKS